MSRLVTFAVAMLLVPVVSGAADKMTKETFGSGGRTRTYYLLVPEAAKKAGSPPLVVLLHGSGRDGKSLVEKWEPLAKKEGTSSFGSPQLSEPSRAGCFGAAEGGYS
jgi:poly(3-hydroxybutyrate) depolymerase